MAFRTFTNVNTTQGSKIVTIDDIGADLTGLNTNWQLDVDGFNGLPIQIASAVDNVVTLTENAPVTLNGRSATVSPSQAPLVALQAEANALNATATRLIETQDNVFTSENETETYTDRQGVDHDYPTMKKFQNKYDEIEQKSGNLTAMRQADFEAMCETNNNLYGGSGFVEVGDAHPTIAVNKGIACPANTSNEFFLGADLAGSTGKISISADGALLKLTNINTDSSYKDAVIKLPPAPDGLDKADGTGRFPDLAAAIVAGGNGLTASVINRIDQVFIEPFDELLDLDNRDMWCPNGSVQYGASSIVIGGVTIPLVDVTTLSVGQGYSAFYEGDTTTVGKVARWSGLNTLQQHVIFGDKPQNIRNTPDGLVQRRYRVRTVAGLEGEWNFLSLDTTGAVGFGVGNYLQPQGVGDVATGLGLFTPESGNALYYGNGWANNIDKQVGAVHAFRDGTNGKSETLAYKGFCIAIPITAEGIAR